ncbi:MAG: hypothetical protein ACYTG0_30915 [Planctomycetota bacterium]
MIEFASNGEVGTELRDSNRAFRIDVGENCMESPSRASDELIRDLYDAETSYSKAAFCVHHKLVAFLATQLLARGGESNIAHYLACVFRGQDAYLSSQCVVLTSKQQKDALSTIDTLVKSAGDDAPSYFERVRANIARLEPAT